VLRTPESWRAEYRLHRRDEKGAVVKANDHLMYATRYLAVSGTNIAELAPGYLARAGHQAGVKADYDPFQ
jgi:hypothetical protein